VILNDLKDIITIRYIQLEFKNEESLSFEFTNGKYLCLEGTVNYEMFEKLGEQKIIQIETYHVDCLNIKLDSICSEFNRIDKYELLGHPLFRDVKPSNIEV